MSKVEFAITEKLKEVMKLLNIVETDSNRDTPKRIAQMLKNDLFLNVNDSNILSLEESMKMFDCEGYKEKVTIDNIDFSSVCEHHWLPFMGKVKVQYVPSEKIIGLSKIPRVVEFFSRKPQLQERLTQEIGDFLLKVLNPQSLLVEITSTHSCVACRGIRSNCVSTTNFYFEKVTESETCKKEEIDKEG